MDERPTAWVLDKNRRTPRQTTEVIATEVETKDRFTGDTASLIVTDLMNVYSRFPLLNLFSGAKEEMWLTREQCEHFRTEGSELNRAAPNDRMFDLPALGLILPGSGKNALYGFAQATSYHILMDGEGHIWHGRHDQASVRAYMHQTPQRSLELRFTYPYLSYIGPDEEEIWLHPWSDHKQKVRLTICTYIVHTVLEKLGMQNHYFPKGAARTDPGIAQTECKKMHAMMMDTLVKAKAQATCDLEIARATMAILDEKAIQSAKELTETKAALVEAEKNAAPANSFDYLQQETAVANERAQVAENALATARECNEGWDWSNILGDD